MAGISSPFVLQLPAIVVAVLAVAAFSLYLTTVAAGVAGLFFGLVTAIVVSIISES